VLLLASFRKIFQPIFVPFAQALNAGAIQHNDHRQVGMGLVPYGLVGF
jgi:hypothetical protein